MPYPAFAGHSSSGSFDCLRELGTAYLVAQAGRLVMIRIYLDESGTHERSPVVAVGAYAGRLETWPAVIAEWNSAKGPIKVFHSTDCAALQGEFEGWTAEERDELVARLLAVPAKHELYGIAMGINLDDFRDAVEEAPELEAMLLWPYGMSFQWVLHSIIERTEQAGIRNEPLALFHEQNDFQGDALKAFEWVKRRRQLHVGPMTITFVEKDAFVPLQAADVLAYEANKRLRDPSKPQRRSIAVLGDKVTVEGFAKPNRDRLIAKAKEFARLRERRRRDGEG